jgi:hypothetical protein
MPSTKQSNVQGATTPLIEVSTKCVFTNTSHVAPVAARAGETLHGAVGRAAAAEMEIDRIELRRRNQIKPANPDQGGVGQLRQR